MDLCTKVEHAKPVQLADIDPDFTGDWTEEEASEKRAKLCEELGEQQELLYGARQHSVLIVLQGMDTSGKDGTIRKVMSEVNPQGCRVESFKVPTEEELSHDYLWRVHRVTPPRGMLTIFNRSHYEDVVVVRVHDLVPRNTWKQRYDQINHFERLLIENQTIIMKFFLHISRREQKKRLADRERDIEKAWKISVGDWKERKHWNAYMDAYDDALSKCSSKESPWYIVPANHKWFRNLAIADVIVQTLRPYAKTWERTMGQLSKAKLEELRALRK